MSIVILQGCIKELHSNEAGVCTDIETVKFDYKIDTDKMKDYDFRDLHEIINKLKNGKGLILDRIA